MSGAGILIGKEKREWLRLQTVLNSLHSTVSTVSTQTGSFATQAQISRLQAEIDELTAIVDAISAGGFFTFQALTAVSPFTVLYEASAGGVMVVDSTSAVTGEGIVGIATSGAAAGSTVQVAGSGATVTSPGWSWTPGQPVFATAAGQLTQTQPATSTSDVFCAVIGYAVTATSVLVWIGEPEFFTYTNDGAALVRSAAGQLQQYVLPLPVAGTGIDITADSAGNLVFTAMLLAGFGIDITPDSNGRLVISTTESSGLTKTDEFSVSGSGPYTLSHTPNGLWKSLELDGIRQPDTSSSVAGTNLTLVGVTTANYATGAFTYTY